MLGLITAAMMTVGLLAGSPEQPAQWEASYGKALEATRKSDTPLLVVLDKPGSSEAVKPELLGKTDGEKAELLKPYRLCHVDVSTEYGKKVASAFKVTTVPTVAIIDKTGSKVIYRKTGQIKAEEWNTMLVDHQRGEGPVRKVLSRITGSSSKPYCPNCQRNNF